MTCITRFAPSPTGRLHLGHAYSAITAHDFARAQGGRFLLRIEDIDTTRCRPEYEQAIFDDLEWLGLTWETPIRRQSDHFADYAEALEKLRALGVLYRCFRTRSEIAEASASAPQAGDPTGAQDAPILGPISADEEAERLERGETFAWRLSLSCSQDLLGEKFTQLGFRETGAGPNGEQGAISARPEACGEGILARKDTSTSYHLSVVHDDALQGVTHVVRGADLFDATPVHVLLQALLGYPTPIYHHHKLLLGPDGKRFAKRDKSLTLAALRAEGVTPADIRRQVGLPT